MFEDSIEVWGCHGVEGVDQGKDIDGCDGLVLNFYAASNSVSFSLA